MRSFFLLLLTVLFPITLLRTYVVQAFRIPTGAMKDTILIGDFLLVNKFIYGTNLHDSSLLPDFVLPYLRLPALKSPEQGDIVVFKYPLDPTLDYIKRCIAIGGQTIEIRDGEVYVDGLPEGRQEFIKKEYDPEEGHYVIYYKLTTPNDKIYTIRRHADRYSKEENLGPIRVPDRHYFMMGDNRDNSADSRVWGFLPRDNVVGKAFVFYSSWDKQVPLYRIFEKIRWRRIGVLIR